MTEPTTVPAPRAARRLQRLARHRHWLAPLSLAAGLASFLLIHRTAELAKALAVLLLLSWLVLLLEPLLVRRRWPRALLRYGVQAVHQETFFFALPFFFLTTTWSSPQALFTGALAAAGLATLWDPLYFGVIAARRPLFLIFHALAVFTGMLVALPLLAHLTTAQSLSLAAAAVALLSMPGLALMLERQPPRQAWALFAGAAALGALAWLGRIWVPPATLWVPAAAITESLDFARREPGLVLHSVSPAQLREQGLYAYTAIHAPRGLRERVFHRWLHEGVEVDRIALDIVGGREQGYRAWTYKRSFPEDPRGRWRVDAVTEGGQLIGRLEFSVIGS